MINSKLTILNWTFFCTKVKKGGIKGTEGREKRDKLEEKERGGNKISPDLLV